MVNGHTISLDSQAKYLGIIIDDEMCFNAHGAYALAKEQPGFSRYADCHARLTACPTNSYGNSSYRFASHGCYTDATYFAHTK